MENLTIARDCSRLSKDFAGHTFIVCQKPIKKKIVFEQLMKIHRKLEDFDFINSVITGESRKRENGES